MALSDAQGHAPLWQAALVAGRTVTTIRAWTTVGLLHPQDTGIPHARGTVKLYELDELHRVNTARGGSWYPERLRRETDDAALAAALAASEAERAALAAMTRGDLTAVWEAIDALRAENARLRANHVNRMGKMMPALPDAGVDGHEAGSTATLERAPTPGNSPTVTPRASRAARVPHAPKAALALPDGLVGLNAFATTHGVTHNGRSNIYKRVHKGDLPIVEGHWVQGFARGTPMMALDASGRGRFYTLFHRSEWFTPCPECPHALAAPLE